MVALFPHIVKVSLVAAAVLILGRQLAGEDGAILKYLIVVAGRRQVRRVEVGITVMELDARQLVFVEMNINSRSLKRRIGDDDEKLLDDVSRRRTPLTDEAFVNHWLEFIQHLVIFTLCEFLLLPPQASQLSLNFAYSVLNSGRSKSFV